MKTDAEGVVWTGWHRSTAPNSAWHAVCQSESYDSCADLLETLVGGGHRCVLAFPRQPPDWTSEDSEE
jgi:hypothetical protein